jgi:acyl dehydratase
LTPRLSFDAPPSVAACYLRAALDRRPRRLPPGSGTVAIEASAASLRADPGRLETYRQVCGLPDGDELPLTYPHVMAGGVHMAMLLHPDFPVRLLGLVHLANDIEQLRPLPVAASLALECRLEAGRSKARGDEFQLVTEARHEGEPAWRETMRFLAPAPRKGRRRPVEAPALPPVVATWDVPADTGRAYARVSGDWNPIHLAAMAARPFGFPGAIAHGMWSLARCLGGLAPTLPAAGARLEARFLKPLLLPGRVELRAGTKEEDGSHPYWLVSAADQTPHLKGSWRPGPA